MNRQIYYHYLSSSEYAIDNLTNEWIKVSTLDILNDPFEMMPYLRYRFKDRQPYHKLRRKITNEVGLVCFSRSWSETLLWSHYANRHKGIVLGFNILKDEILKVDYNHDPIRKQIVLSGDGETNKKLILNLAKVKFHKWNYEDEYRIIVKLKRDCITSTNNGHYYLKFKDGLIVKRIILGCKFDSKMEHNKLKDILKLAKQFGLKVEQARMEWKGYRILIDRARTNALYEMQKGI